MRFRAYFDYEEDEETYESYDTIVVEVDPISGVTFGESKELGGILQDVVSTKKFK